MSQKDAAKSTPRGGTTSAAMSATKGTTKGTTKGAAKGAVTGTRRGVGKDPTAKKAASARKTTARTGKAASGLKPVPPSAYQQAVGKRVRPAVPGGVPGDYREAQSGLAFVAGPAGSGLSTVATILADLSARMLRTAASLGPAIAAVEVDASPQMVRAARAQEIFYDRIDGTFGLLSASEAGRRMGSTATRPDNLATHARKAGRLLALERGSRLLFPGWNFDADGQPLPVVADLRVLGAQHGRSERGIIEWASAPSAFFGGDAPASYLAVDPELVLQSAANAWSTEW
ncbi:hypothetical protein [Nocardioides plantarum]|uniref:Uncharacterized protein n=1 Tax=Nocardioides plantarum TaxID=29299 RepID=A0ABV5KI25_9ACTN|nr:hypothetical protein [Nocardioides plantarum]